MLAIKLEWAGDLEIGPTGDLQTLPVSVEVQRRVIRRLLTNPGEYIWNINYGAGLGGYVGTEISQFVIQKTIRQQLRYEPLVDQVPTPNIIVQAPSPNKSPEVAVTIGYHSNGSLAQAPIALGIEVNSQ